MSFLNMLVGSALLSACALSVDPSLIRPDGGDDDDASDAGEPVSESDAGSDLEPPEDAGAANGGHDADIDARATEDDASYGPDPYLRDAALLGADAWPTEPNPVACVADADCAPQEYCAFETCSTVGCSRTCQARCSETYGCAGPAADAENIEVMATSGDILFWSTPPDRDALGNVLNGGRIWSWRRTTPASAPVERESGELLLTADDYLYFRRPASHGAPPTMLFRRSLATPDSPATQLATEVVRAWKTPGHVVWARKEGSTEELWRLSRSPGAVAERVAVTQAGHWSSSNSTLAIKSLALMQSENVRSVRFTVVRLADEAEVGTVESGFSDTEQSAADEDYLYFQRDNELRRAPFTNLTQQLILARSMEPGGATFAFELDGSWLYWEYAFPGGAGRSQRDLMVNPPEALVASGPGTARIDNELFYFHDGHVFYKPMKPLACSAAMACPADMTCSASMVCE